MSGQRPATMDRARLERQMRELALEHAAARLDDAEYLARMARLRGELEIVGARPARDLPARRDRMARRPRRNLAEDRHLVEEKSDVIHAIYERIVIEGPRFVDLRLTPAAYRNGLALALPEAVMARPTGFSRVDAMNIRIPIEGQGRPARRPPCWPARPAVHEVDRPEAKHGVDPPKRPRGSAVQSPRACSAHSLPSDVDLLLSRSRGTHHIRI